MPYAPPSTGPAYGEPHAWSHGGPPNYGPPPGYGPPPNYGPAAAYGPTPAPPSPTRAGTAGFFRNAAVAWIVAGVLALTVVGLSLALGSQNTTASRATTPIGGSAPRTGMTPGGSNATGPFGGSPSFGGDLGVVGTVKSTAGNAFTVTDRTGTTVTVKEQSSTIYFSGRTNATSSIVTTGSRVLVRGTRTGTTVTATSVIVLPMGGFGPGPSASG